MDLGSVKRRFQNFLGEGLLLVVGSGLSCAEGLPSMGALADAVDGAVATQPDATLKTAWASISTRVPEVGFEAALQAQPPDAGLGVLVRGVIIDEVGRREQEVVQQVLQGRRTLLLTRLLKHVSFSPFGLPIITTNYDRLVELACETIGIAVDTLFDGQVIGQLSPERWQYAQIREMRTEPRTGQRATYRNFAQVLKPHGSLDWWAGAGKPFRYGGPLGAERLLVTPGEGKYRAGYSEPFDTHRVLANQRVERCERILLIGYGFNDDHLEAARLIPHINAGKPTLLITRELSDNARRVLQSAPKMYAIESAGPPGDEATTIHIPGGPQTISGSEWWKIDRFVEEVLE